MRGLYLIFTSLHPARLDFSLFVTGYGLNIVCRLRLPTPRVWNNRLVTYIGDREQSIDDN